MHLIHYLAAAVPSPHPSAPAPPAGSGSGSWAAVLAGGKMAPGTVFVLLLFALVIDWMSIGPNSIRDRIAWAIALPTIYEGFGGGPAQYWTVGQVDRLLAAARNSTGGVYALQFTATAVLSGVLGVIAIWTCGVLLPEKLSKRLGKFAKLSFGESGGALNKKLWFSATSLGLLADLAGGLVGSTLHAVISFLAPIVALIPNLLFGMS